MGQQVEYFFPDLSGGQNDGVDPTRIADNQGSRVWNYLPTVTGLRRRYGTTELTTNPAASIITGMVNLYFSGAPTWWLILGHPTGFSYWTGGTGAPTAFTNTLTTNNGPWGFVVRNEVAYAARARPGIDATTAWQGIRRLDSRGINETAGIPAPASAPTLAAGTVGIVVAGNYQGVYTYYNSLTDQDSNPSPPSAVYAHAGSFTIAWSGVSVSTTGQVNQRRLWRTQTDQQGVYFFVHTIADNTSTTYNTDNATTDDMGRAVSFRNGVPPASSECIASWQERMWTAFDSDLSWSEIGLFEGFAAANTMKIAAKDGQRIRALIPHDQRMYVCKDRSIHYVTGTGNTSFDRHLWTDEHGVFAFQTAKVVDDTFIFFAGDHFMRSDGGARPWPISDVKVRRVVESMTHAQKYTMSAEIIPEENLYVASFATTGGVNTTTLNYNYRTDAWTVCGYFEDAGVFLGPLTIYRGFNSSGSPVVYASFYDDHVYNLWDKTSQFDGDPASVPFTSSFTSKGLNRAGGVLGVRSVSFLRRGGDSGLTLEFTVKVLNEFNETPVKSVGPIQDGKQDSWVKINCSTMSNPASTVRVQVDVDSLNDPVDIEQLQIQAVHHARRIRELS